MCGRFTLAVDPADLQDTFSFVAFPTEMNRRYNIAPTQPVAVVPNDGQNKLDYFTWGLIPSWAKDVEIGNRMINARVETIAEKPSFRSAFRRRRCLILADGFYEWRQNRDGKSKTPMFIHLKSGKPFAFAGLWERWNAPDGSNILSTTIITTQPNELMQHIHNRMPVILRSTDYDLWLEPEEQKPEKLMPALAPYAAEEMEAYTVARLVNSPSNEGPQLIAKVEE